MIEHTEHVGGAAMANGLKRIPGKASACHIFSVAPSRMQ